MNIRIIIILLLFPALLKGQEYSDARRVYNEMMHAIEHLETSTFEIEINERVFGKMMYSHHTVKLQLHPYKVYIYCQQPEAGAEILYLQGKNNNKVLVNPNRFPFFNLNVSPFNSLLRKNHHYIVPQMGFSYLYNILRHYESVNHEKFYSMLKLNESSDNKYLVLEINNNEFGFMNYKMGKNENITDAARKFYVNDQMVLELNKPEVDDFNDVREGQVITVPNSYGKRIVFYIDKTTKLPVLQYIYDQKGLYSKIVFSHLIVNPVLKPEEFTKEYSGYNF